MDKNLLISFKDYLVTEHNQPYFYSVQSPRQVLYYFGAKHTKDPTHPQFKLLKEKWQEFLSKTSSTKQVVFFEGAVRIIPEMVLEEVIEKYGESGAIVFWANQLQVVNFHLEPPTEHETKELLKNFSQEEVFYFCMLRKLMSWQRGSEPKDFDEFLKINTKYYHDVLDWEGFNFSFEVIQKVHRDIFGKDFDLSDKDFISKISNPTYNISRINEIARRSSDVRNLAILDHIEKYWREGYNIFVVYGASHAVMQEPAIKSLVRD